MFPSFESGFGGGVGVGVGVPVGLGLGVGVGEGVGVGDGVGVGLGVGVGEGHGVGAGDVRSLPSNVPGLEASGTAGVDDVAFELKTIHRPSVLTIGRLFAISMRTLAPVPAEQVLYSTLWVSVI